MRIDIKKVIVIFSPMISARPGMTAAELIAALHDLNMEQIELARLVDAGPATVRRWVSGKGDIPGSASLLVRLLVARPELKELIGARPRSGRGRPVKERD